MHPNGNIYQKGKSPNHGEIVLLLPALVRLGHHFIRGIGAGLIALSVLIFMSSFGPILEQEVNYELVKFGLKKESKVTYDYGPEIIEAQNILNVQKEARDLGVNSYFSVSIPKINAVSNIIANVDAGDDRQYQDALKKGVAHAKGTYFPGQGGRIFVFSHSTDSPLNFARYNAIFYLLRKLEEGDEIIIFFADKKYTYQVSGKIITDAKDVSWLEAKKDGEELVLMTCDPPGTTWNRLLVVAKPLID